MFASTYHIYIVGGLVRCYVALIWIKRVLGEYGHCIAHGAAHLRVLDDDDIVVILFAFGVDGIDGNHVIIDGALIVRRSARPVW